MPKMYTVYFETNDPVSKRIGYYVDAFALSKAAYKTTNKKLNVKKCLSKT